jgi:hypothetical protein
MNTKRLVLAASMVAFVATAGQAYARTSAHERYRPAEAAPMSEALRPANAFDTFDSTMPSQAIEPAAHRYEGGPKSND